MAFWHSQNKKIFFLILIVAIFFLLIVATHFFWRDWKKTDNQCNPRWYTQLETDIETPTPYMNNSDTGYTESFFLLDPKIKLVLKGSFPLVRFISFQTYSSLKFNVVSALFDYQITTDAGSSNPYIPGTPIGISPRNYTIEILPQGAVANTSNVLRMGSDTLQMLLLRFYSPGEGVTLGLADLPKIYAYDAMTGAPAKCPTFLPVPPITKIPFQLMWGSNVPTPQSETAINFKLVSASDKMMNSAVPAYLGVHHDMDLGRVAVIRFKAPTFVNTRSGPGTFPSGQDMRYWSFSAVDPTDSYTFGGLPDYLATQDANGYVTVVVSNSKEVQSQAKLRGHDFIMDARSPKANSVIFVYRNVLPSASFWPDPNTYPSEYYPTGLICSASDYLAGLCNQ